MFLRPAYQDNTMRTDALGLLCAVQLRIDYLRSAKESFSDNPPISQQYVV